MLFAAVAGIFRGLLDVLFSPVHWVTALARSQAHLVFRLFATGLKGTWEAWWAPNGPGISPTPFCYLASLFPDLFGISVWGTVASNGHYFQTPWSELAQGSLLSNSPSARFTLNPNLLWIRIHSEPELILKMVVPVDTEASTAKKKY